MDVELYERGFKFFNRLCKNEATSFHIMNIIETFYNLPKRHYHNINHVEHCLKELDSIPGILISRPILECAIWFHDIVYIPGKRYNEQLSVDLFNTVFGLGLPKFKYIEFVNRLILSTNISKALSNSIHTITESPYLREKKWISDIDLSILGQDWKTFCEYDRTIELEFCSSGIPIEAYKKGRREFFDKVLTWDTIYLTEEFKPRYEKKARSNIKKWMKNNIVQLYNNG